MSTENATKDLPNVTAPPSEPSSNMLAAKSKPKLKKISRYVWFSGWEISPDDFQTFARSMPGFRLSKVEHGKQSALTCILAYDSWRRKVIGQKLNFVPPVLRTRPIDPKDSTSEIVGIFFPVRWVQYVGRGQVEDDAHPDAARIKVPTETDVAKLHAFVAFVRESGGELDPSKARFGYMKEINPKYDTKNF